MNEENNKTIHSLVESIKTSHDDTKPSKKVKAKKNIGLAKENNDDDKTDFLRGKPKSGRFWKDKKEKFSSINKTKGVKLDFQKKTSLRLELKRIKDLSNQRKGELEQREIERKERRRQNLKRTEENRKKAEVVQVISNTAKLKRMRKKQLRFIQKRDTTVVEPNK